MSDIQIKDIADLGAATEDQGGTIYIDQGGLSKKAAVKSAIWKDAKAAGSGTTGDVPTLDSAGAVSPADGGTGASISQATLDQASNEGKAITVQRTGSTGSLGIGGISVNAIDADSLATVAEILEPTPGDPKLVTNTGLNDKIEEIETVLEHSWGDWSSTSVTRYIENSNLTGAENTLASLAGLENVVMFGTNSYHAPVLSDTQAELYLASAAVLTKPNITPASDLKGGVIFVDGDNRRWFYTQGLTFLFADSNSQDFYYYDNDSSSWVYQGPHGEALRTSVASLPDDSRWYPISEKAHDAPFNSSTGIKFEEFNNFPFIAKRTGTTYYAMRIAYQGTPSERFAFIQRTREFTGVIGAGAIGDGSVSHSKLAADAVEADNIKNGAVVHSKLATDAVETDNIKDDAVTQDKMADDSVGLAQLKTTNPGTDGQALTRNAAGTLTFVTISGGGGGGSSTPTDGSVTTAKLASTIYASEEEVLNDGTGDNKLVSASTLKELLDDVDNETSWKPWSSVTQTNQSTLTNGDSWSNLDIGGLRSISIVDSSSYNMGTFTVSASRPVMFGPSCTGKPTLSQGSLKGYLVVLTGDSRRFAITIGDTNILDSEATWEYVNGSWESRGYRGDDLKTSYGAIRPNTTFEVLSSLAIGGPSDNAFNDEVAVARSDGRKRYALRVAYSTANSRFEIFTASSEAAYVLQDGEVETANIANLAVTHDKLATNSVDSDNILDDAITSALLGPGAVDHAALGDDAVESGNIKDGAVVHAALGNDAVEADNIKDNAVGYEHLNISGKAANKYLTINSDNNGLSAVTAPSPSVVQEDIQRFNPPIRAAGTIRTLPSGKSFADYDFLIVEFYLTDATFFSPLLPHKLTIADDDRVIAIGRPVADSYDAEKLIIDIQSNTTWIIDRIGSSYNTSAEGVVALIGVKFQ